MDPVHILMDPVHGPGPWRGSMDQGSMFCTFPSVLIFSILNHPCSFMVYYYLFGVFSIFVKYYFQVSSNLTVILSMINVTQNTVTVLF